MTSRARRRFEDAATIAILERLTERDHYVAKENQPHETGYNKGRYYYPLATGRRRYVPHDPIALLIQRGYVEYAMEYTAFGGDPRLKVSTWGKAWLKTIND